MKRGVSALVAALSLVALPGAVSLPAHATSASQDPAVAAEDETLAPVMDPAAADVDGTRLVAIAKPGVTQAEVDSQVAAVDAAATTEGEWLAVDPAQPASGLVEIEATSEQAAASLAQAMVDSGLYEAVEYVHQVVTMAYSTTPNDPALTSQWELKAYPGIRANEVWPRLANAAPAEAVPIASIDQGLRADAADLTGAVRRWDAGCKDWTVTPNSPDEVHGAETASILGAATGNGTLMASTAWDAKVLIYKVTDCDRGEMDSADIAAAMRQAAADGARIISLSLGYYGGASDLDTVWQKAIDEVVAQGVLVVASAGNGARCGVINGYCVTNPLSWPAAYPPVLSVAASTNTGTAASFSTYNQYVDVAAPGAGVTVLMNSNTQVYTDNGTSFSAPLVSAAASVVWRINPRLTATDVASILTSTAHDAGAAGKDNHFGYGIIDLVAAADKAPTVGPALTYSTFTISPDLTGDGLGEVLALTTGGQLRLQQVKADGTLGALKVLVSSGLTGQRIYGPGDWDGDKKADVVTVDSAGNMWLRKGTGSGSVGGAVQIGRGWTAYRIVPAGDLNGDKANDLLAIDSAGRLWLYAGDGKGAFLQGRTEVGHGWSGFDCFAAADLNRDGKNDILGVRADGTLWAYLGKGNGSFQAATQVGKGWGGFTLAAGGDLTGDSLADIVGRNDLTGQLYLYRSKGGGSFAAATALAWGW
jgi:hypothetical protein